MSIKFFRIITVIIFVFITLFLLYSLFDKHFALNGLVEVNYDFKSKSPLITNLLPNGRVGDVNKDKYGYYAPIQIDPVYFQIKPPIEYEIANVCIDYTPTPGTVLYMGGQLDRGYNYDLEPLQNNIIDKLFENSDWNIIKEERDVLLLQKSNHKKFSNINDFFADIPALEEVAVFNYDLDFEYKLSSYKRKKDNIIINTTLRGPHSMLTYVKDEPLEFTFSIQDLNRHDGPDTFEVIVLKNGQGHFSKKLEDDGYVLSTDPSSKRRHLHVYVSNLEEGVYNVELKTNQDIFIREINTRQSYLVFKNNLYLADNIEYRDGILDLNYESNQLFTKGNNFSFRTTHKSGMQTLLVNDEEVVIDQTHKMFYHTASKGDLNKVDIPDNDIILHTNGLISFHKDDFFDPNIIKIGEDTEELPENINYIIAKYKKPKKVKGDLEQACRLFMLNDYYLEDNKFKIMLSAPGLELKQKEFNIYNIKATLITNPILNNKNKFTPWLYR